MTETQFPVKLRNPQTGSTHYRIAPPNTELYNGKAFGESQIEDWPVDPGGVNFNAASDDCNPTDPGNPNPVWGGWLPPEITPGASYGFTIPANAATVAGGASLVYRRMSGPSWLNDYTEATRSFNPVIAPPGYPNPAETLVMRAIVVGTGAYADKSFTLFRTQSTTLGMGTRYNASTRQLGVGLKPVLTGYATPPDVKMERHGGTNPWSDTAWYTTSAFGVQFNSVDYPYSRLWYNDVPANLYLLTAKWADGRVRYALVDVSGTGDYTLELLSEKPGGGNPDTGPDNTGLYDVKLQYDVLGLTGVSNASVAHEGWARPIALGYNFELADWRVPGKVSAADPDPPGRATYANNYGPQGADTFLYTIRPIGEADTNKYKTATRVVTAEETGGGGGGSAPIIQHIDWERWIFGSTETTRFIFEVSPPRFETKVELTWFTNIDPTPVFVPWNELSIQYNDEKGYTFSYDRPVSIWTPGAVLTLKARPWYNGQAYPAQEITVQVTIPASGTPEFRSQIYPSGGGGGGIDPINFLSYDNQGWPRSTLTKWIENSEIKVGFSGETGACLTHAILKSVNRDFINTYLVSDARSDDYLGRHGTTFEDKGRSVMFGSDYYTPGNAWMVRFGNGVPYSGPGGYGTKKNTIDYGFDTGGNVVQGGSLGNWYDESYVIKSAIVDTVDRGQVFCAQVRARVWGVPQEYGHIILDQEVWLDGTAICYKARHIVESRSPYGDLTQITFQAREQENPCMYVIAPLTTHVAKIGGQEVNRFPTKWNHPDLSQRNPFSPTVFTDECWIGAYEGSGNGVTYYSPMNSAVRSAQFLETFGDTSSNACSYLNAALSMNYDNPGTYVDYGYIILGTKSQALSKIATLPPIDQSVNFDFTTDNHRWVNADCRMIKESGQWVVYIGDMKTDNNKTQANGVFRSPARAWQASGIGQICFDMIVSGGVQKLWFDWRKPGEDNDTTKYYRVAINVNGNGSRQTVTVNTAGLPGWNGIISTFGLKAIRSEDAAGNPDTPAPAKLIMFSVYKP